ncbi:MAG TPA: class I SAM-dependent methyltransferase [Sphingomicrobium sp.]|jgi:SAM-dependent methyltransferase|nr:class I SAM-dependent methyltransferase [Sphingomicrobium sp.]
MWDQRYQENKPVYGEAANDFLAEQVGLLRPGTCLCLAEGQGRNAVWIAEQGFAVSAMDQSSVGMAKAAGLAAARGVALKTAVGDLADFDLGSGKWDNIVSIFGHLPGPLRRDVHRRVVEALRPGGIFLLEAFTPDQLATEGTGGPADPDMLLTIAKLKAELPELEVVFAREILRPVNEGDYHKGDCAVVQFIARKGSGE